MRPAVRPLPGEKDHPLLLKRETAFEDRTVPLCEIGKQRGQIALAQMLVEQRVTQWRLRNRLGQGRTPKQRRGHALADRFPERPAEAAPPGAGAAPERPRSSSQKLSERPPQQVERSWAVFGRAIPAPRRADSVRRPASWLRIRPAPPTTCSASTPSRHLQELLNQRHDDLRRVLLAVVAGVGQCGERAIRVERAEQHDRVSGIVPVVFHPLDHHRRLR